MILSQIAIFEIYVYSKEKGIAHLYPDYHLPLMAMNFIWLGMYILILTN